MGERRGSSVPVRAANGRVVGQVSGDVFHKRVQASRHFLRAPAAIAFDASTLLDAQRAGATWVEVADSESGKVYRASIRAVLQRSFTLDRGHGAQVALPLSQWARDGELVGAQLALFAAV